MWNLINKEYTKNKTNIGMKQSTQQRQITLSNCRYRQKHKKIKSKCRFNLFYLILPLVSFHLTMNILQNHVILTEVVANGMQLIAIFYSPILYIVYHVLMFAPCVFIQSIFYVILKCKPAIDGVTYLLACQYSLMSYFMLYYMWRINTLSQGCSPKKEVGGRLKQDLDKDLQLHRTLILLYWNYLTLRFSK